MKIVIAPDSYKESLSAMEVASESGGDLGRLERIDVAELDARVHDSVFDIACDVGNPIAGPHGASVVFGRQKGARAAMVELLDADLARFARIVSRDPGRQVAAVPGRTEHKRCFARQTANCRWLLARFVRLYPFLEE